MWYHLLSLRGTRWHGVAMKKAATQVFPSRGLVCFEPVKNGLVSLCGTLWHGVSLEYRRWESNPHALSDTGF